MAETLEYDYKEFSQPTREADRNLAVRFYMEPIQNAAKSTDAGRPIFDDTEMIEIRVRGDRNNIINRPVREDDKRRFRDAYRDFKDDSTKAASGTLLSAWPVMSRSTIEEMKYLGFTTVEQIAEAGEESLVKVNGLRSLKEKAQAFLKLAQGAAPIEKMQAELEHERNMRQAAEVQVADLARRLAELESKIGGEAKAPATGTRQR